MISNIKIHILFISGSPTDMEISVDKKRPYINKEAAPVLPTSITVGFFL